MRPSLSDLIVDPSRLRSERAPPQSWKNIPIVHPRPIKTSGLRWVAVRTVPKCERMVSDGLRAMGYEAYCPLGAKFVFWQDGKRAKHRLVKQFPVFCGYIFVGLREGQTIGRYMIQVNDMRLAEKIRSILGDSRGPLILPKGAIAEINEKEILSQWDETKRSPFRINAEVRILNGPLRDFHATVDEVSSEGRIRALVTMFGSQTPVTLDVDNVEVV